LRCSINLWFSLTFSLFYDKIQYNTIQYNTIQYNTTQYNTIQYNTIQFYIKYNQSCNINWLRCSINMWFSLTFSPVFRCNILQYNTIQYNTIQYNTIQYNTIQYNTIQYNTIKIDKNSKNLSVCDVFWMATAGGYNTIQYNTI